MNERYLLETLGRLPQDPVDRVVETLWTIWVRALYQQAALSTDRLSPQDASFLHLEDSSAHMHVAGAMLFAGSAARLRRVHREHRAAAASRTALQAEARSCPARSGPAEVGRRPASEPSLPRAPHRAAGAGQRGPASNARGSRVLAAARPRQAALGALARATAWRASGSRFSRRRTTRLVDGISGVDLVSVLFDVDSGAERPRHRARHGRPARRLRAPSCWPKRCASAPRFPPRSCARSGQAFARTDAACLAVRARRSVG